MKVNCNSVMVIMTVGDLLLTEVGRLGKKTQSKCIHTVCICGGSGVVGGRYKHTDKSIRAASPWLPSSCHSSVCE